MGVAWAWVLGPATVSALSSAPERRAGLAMGASWTFHNLGGAIGLAVGVVLYRVQASTSLDSALPGAAAGTWAEEAAADPSRAAELPAEKTSLSASGTPNTSASRHTPEGTVDQATT
ncbi:hypothetical protein GCM10010329_03010 [Streptomyces spiroverticillatus]|uniref:MFS transporter n=1 Tax=Streptomyces finlayi TaxID=67296 RepID=A0A918WSD2_9ACTN|nr:hypothetical protein [Streptomyces finlayi]GGZ86557.1 hypothetical protein GCM10010329_03010 [Streptomyces spiroverticillatus]GHC78073.1 hypothetical protein GCM10010334_02990 [Streptomyces finlayi]